MSGPWLVFADLGVVENTVLYFQAIIVSVGCDLVIVSMYLELGQDRARLIIVLMKFFSHSFILPLFYSHKYLSLGNMVILL